MQDSFGFWIPGTGFQSLSVELGFWISVINGIRDFLSCIPDSKAQDSTFHEQNFSDLGFHRQKIHGFWNPDTLTWREFLTDWALDE